MAAWAIVQFVFSESDALSELYRALFPPCFVLQIRPSFWPWVCTEKFASFWSLFWRHWYRDEYAFVYLGVDIAFINTYFYFAGYMILEQRLKRRHQMLKSFGDYCFDAKLGLIWECNMVSINIKEKLNTVFKSSLLK